MTSLPIGVLGMAALIWLSLRDAEAAVFINPHAIILVWGGTFAVLLASTPWHDVGLLLRSLFHLIQNEEPIDDINRQIVGMAKGNRKTAGSSHPLLHRAVSLWEQGIDPDLFEVLLQQHLEEINQAFEQTVATLRNLSKYPPALGMTGTVMGLVTLFSQLSPDKSASMGASLALAMTATFYGLILANGLILPLADRLSVQQASRVQTNDHVFRALILVHRGEAPAIVEDKLRAFAA